MTRPRFVEPDTPISGEVIGIVQNGAPPDLLKDLQEQKSKSSSDIVQIGTLDPPAEAPKQLPDDNEDKQSPSKEESSAVTLPSNHASDPFLSKKAFFTCPKCGQSHEANYEWLLQHGDHIICRNCRTPLDMSPFIRKISRAANHRDR